MEREGGLDGGWVAQVSDFAHLSADRCGAVLFWRRIDELLRTYGGGEQPGCRDVGGWRCGPTTHPSTTTHPPLTTSLLMEAACMHWCPRPDWHLTGIWSTFSTPFWNCLAEPLHLIYLFKRFCDSITHAGCWRSCCCAGLSRTAPSGPSPTIITPCESCLPLIPSPHTCSEPIPRAGRWRWCCCASSS